ncbi:MAG: hypothetical protein KAR42_15035 [candidate division Zixibacteria bacterium]|nr:hypothetical protein [candidate division Zixibacteria bacterium]
MCDNLCIGNRPTEFNPRALGHYGELFILDTDSVSFGITPTPVAIAPMQEGVHKGIVLSGAAGRLIINARGAYEFLMDMSFSLSSGQTVTIAFYVNNVLVDDSEQELEVQNSNVVVELGGFGFFETSGVSLPAIIETRISASSATTLSIEHLTFGVSGIG